MPEISRPALLDGSFHHHLLRDRARLDAFAQAIRDVVRPGDVVADIGSGSGVLAFLAAKAGARRVHAVEFNTNSFRMLLRLSRVNGVSGVVVPTLSDGTQWRPPEGVDVVFCELMETGLLHEPMAAVMRAVHSWPSRPRAVVPGRVRLLVEGVELDDIFLGYRAPLPGFRGDGEGAALTDRAVYASYDFLEAAPGESVEAEFRLRVARDGECGGLQLRTLSLLAPGVELLDSPSYCSPVTLTLDEPLRVRAGDELVGCLSYDFGHVEPLRFELRRSG